MNGIIDGNMLWRQFGAAIDALGGALTACPDALWEEQLWTDLPDQWVAPGFSAFWYLGYHTIFWIDLYLTGAEEGFRPPEPFDLVEMMDGETLPRVYSRTELLGYLELVRRRAERAITTLTPEAARRACSFAWGTLPYGELMLYTLRHVQEHAAQMQLFLGQRTGRGGEWVPGTGEEL